jgi:hypothetical protein
MISGPEANMLGNCCVHILIGQDEVSSGLMHDGSADPVVDTIHQNKKMKSVAFEHTLLLRKVFILVCQKILIANNGESRVAIRSYG